MRNSWLILLLGTLGCRELGLVQGTPRERYERALSGANLAQTALATQWFGAARGALVRPVSVTLPFRETGFFPAERPAAAGYRFPAERGQRLVVELSHSSSEPARVFLDLYQVGDTTRGPDHRASADSGETALDIEVEESGDYLVQVQAELLRSVRYTVTIQVRPVLSFPVDGVGNDAIRSGFGADRDAGRRRHEGIDIFAPRGTPVVAAARGRIVNVGDNRLGGRVIWLRDEARNHNLYYAHLDEQLAWEGQSVEPGDTLGTVGNTGNARTTPYHLHFGIYRRGEGAINPFPFVYRTPDRAPPIQADTTRLGDWIRISTRRAVLSANPADTLERATLMRVIGVTGTRYRVELPNGRVGFVAEGSVQAAQRPVGRRITGVGDQLRELPRLTAVVVDSLRAGLGLGVLGRFGDFELVETDSGTVGWLKK